MAQAERDDNTPGKVVRLYPRPAPRRRIRVWVDADLWQALLDAGRAVRPPGGDGEA